MSEQPTYMDRFRLSDEELDEIGILYDLQETPADRRRRLAARRAKWRARVRRLLLLDR